MTISPSGLTVVLRGSEAGVEWVICNAPPFAAPALNGYCRVPDGDHDWYELIDVHGGVTFGGSEWIGFDTLHAGDQWPGNDLFQYEGEPWAINWTQEMVLAETKRMARQVADISNYSEFHEFARAVNSDSDQGAGA